MGKVTIRDVALRAGVSIATVSNALSGRKHVGDEVRGRVLEAAKALNFHIDRAASQLKSGRAKVIGVLVPNFNDTFFTSIVSRIEQLADSADYQVVVISAQNSPAIEMRRLDALLGWNPSGIIACPCTNVIPAALHPEMGAPPVVLVDRVGRSDLGFDSVTIDNHAAGWQAAELLLDQGHEDILIASSVSSLRPIRERIAGVKAHFLARVGVEPSVVDLGLQPQDGAEVLFHWLQRPRWPTAVVTMTNVSTLATLLALSRLQKEVPKDISFIGFDDDIWMSARAAPLAAVRQPIETIADAAWQQLMQRIAGDESAPHNLILPVSLEARATILPPEKR